MKRFILLFCLAFNCTFSYAQSLTASSTVVQTGSVVTLTAIDETTQNHFMGILFDYFNSSTSSPNSTYMPYISLSIITTVQNFSPGLGTPIPSKYSFTISNTSTSPVTINIAFNSTISGLGGNITKYVTLTVNPQTTFFNAAKSGTFTRNNCGPGTVGTAVTYTVPANTYSASSQSAADQLAENAVNSGGQAYANANGQCLTAYYNAQISNSFTKNDCGPGYNPSATTYTYTVPANAHVSTISQADADLKALNDLNTNGQANANNLGTCDEIRIGFKTKFRAAYACDESTETLSKVWIKETSPGAVDLSGIGLNSVASSGKYAYTDQIGDNKAPAGWYTQLYSDPSDGAYIRVFQVGAYGEIVSYTMCLIP